MLLLNVMLALVWMVLTADFTQRNFVVGFVFAYLLLWLLRGMLPAQDYFSKVKSILAFALYFLWQLILANLRVAFIVLSPRLPLRPAIIAVPLDIKTPVAITILANLIALTPGTLVMDVSPDRNTIYVHTVFVEDAEAFRHEIKYGLERRIAEVLS